MKMKKLAWMLPLSLLVTIFGGCIKDTDSCQPKTVDSEDAAMQAYAATTGVTFTKHSSGLYYYIDAPGSGVTPASTNTVSVKYVGKLTTGTVFDQTTTTPISFTLGGVILGWQLGVPLIKKGGKIRLIIPSSYAYGCTANGPIPAYSILYFEIELIDVL
jgi:FKBP-type peptidyl-prolyl cis-trans isomerase FkpA